MKRAGLIIVIAIVVACAYVYLRLPQTVSSWLAFSAKSKTPAELMLIPHPEACQIALARIQAMNPSEREELVPFLIKAGFLSGSELAQMAERPQWLEWAQMINSELAAMREDEAKMLATCMDSALRDLSPAGFQRLFPPLLEKALTRDPSSLRNFSPALEKYVLDSSELSAPLLSEKLFAATDPNWEPLLIKWLALTKQNAIQQLLKAIESTPEENLFSEHFLDLGQRVLAAYVEAVKPPNIPTFDQYPALRKLFVIGLIYSEPRIERVPDSYEVQLQDAFKSKDPRLQQASMTILGRSWNVRQQSQTLITTWLDSLPEVLRLARDHGASVFVKVHALISTFSQGQMRSGIEIGGVSRALQRFIEHQMRMAQPNSPELAKTVLLAAQSQLYPQLEGFFVAQVKNPTWQRTFLAALMQTQRSSDKIDAAVLSQLPTHDEQFRHQCFDYILARYSAKPSESQANPQGPAVAEPVQKAIFKMLEFDSYEDDVLVQLIHLVPDQWSKVALTKLNEPQVPINEKGLAFRILTELSKTDPSLQKLQPFWAVIKNCPDTLKFSLKPLLESPDATTVRQIAQEIMNCSHLMWDVDSFAGLVAKDPNFKGYLKSLVMKADRRKRPTLLEILSKSRTIAPSH